MRGGPAGFASYDPDYFNTLMRWMGLALLLIIVMFIGLSLFWDHSKPRLHRRTFTTPQQVESHPMPRGYWDRG